MQIEMTADFKVAPDGFTVSLWTVGSVHEVSEQLGGDLIAAGKAQLAREESPAPAAPAAPAPKPRAHK